MHPHLDLHIHPHCVEAIKELERCHEENPVKKFFGVCNQVRRDMDKCLTEEVSEIESRLLN
jgi:COX assembly protein 2